MTQAAADGVRPTGKRRGGPARIDRAAIVEAARGMAPKDVTMQAIANVLGVDRTAINYHVSNRDGLLQLVAADVFEEQFESVVLLEEHGWEVVLRAWASAVRNSMVETGVLANYYRISGDNLAVLRPAETVLQSMLRAGFDEEFADRTLVFVTNFAMAAGRDAVMVRAPEGHPQAPELRRALEEHLDEGGYEAIRRMAETGLNAAGDVDRQFAFEVDLVVAAVAARSSARTA
ncbi:TetR/AcrR family transcriptional regulator C-terminal domain-containing protein [Curtobacterium sp. VKM Ac-2887]|uniref:TetR/AcrR family transcriptional regulator C-terminal domain-containing protein n=1 Tax=Curtobacterium sp. VKM Ac-2887 TaxID=2783819 RepID=UPI001889FB3E|nr:TetR/AcrR family transcriptional regulator C-terminal domain-containing protein [Curtobacterium sp. VKM Ac-2887]